MTIFSFNYAIREGGSFREKWTNEDRSMENTDVQPYQDDECTSDFEKETGDIEYIERRSMKRPRSPDYAHPALEDEDTLSSSETEEVEEYQTELGGPLSPLLDIFDEETQLAIPRPNSPNYRALCDVSDSCYSDYNTEAVRPRKIIKTEVRYFQFSKKE